MVLDVQPRILLVNRRRAVWRYWPPRSEQRERATQVGFAQALGVSVMSVNRFEAEQTSPLEVADYEAYLLVLEREVEEARNAQ